MLSRINIFQAIAGSEEQIAAIVRQMIIMTSSGEFSPQGGGRQMAVGLAIRLPNLSTMSERHQKAQEIGETTVDLVSIASNAQNWIAKPIREH